VLVKNIEISNRWCGNTDRKWKHYVFYFPRFLTVFSAFRNS
jgi:hypothetical protein